MQRSRAAEAGWTVGIDEVGRGALAGPVVVAAAAVPARFARLGRGLGTGRGLGLGALKDSKKLTPAARERWAAYFSSHPDIRFSVARVYPRRIEKMNISRAANLAALRSCERLFTRGLPPGASALRVAGTKRIASTATPVFLDGGLYLGGRERQERSARRRATTVVKGDEKIVAVAVASIIAKVYRDRLMSRLANRHPGYGFEIHKGYGTAAHLRALRRRGPSPAHRLTFIKKSLIIRERH